MADKFDAVLVLIANLYPEGVSASAFHRVNLFYTLFTVCAHSLYGIKGFQAHRVPLSSANEIQRARNQLDRVDAHYWRKSRDMPV